MTANIESFKVVMKGGGDFTKTTAPDRDYWFEDEEDQEEECWQIGKQKQLERLEAYYEGKQNDSI